MVVSVLHNNIHCIYTVTVGGSRGIIISPKKVCIFCGLLRVINLLAYSSVYILYALSIVQTTT